MWQDKSTRRLVGWTAAASMSDELVIKALEKAVGNGFIMPGAIIHTDRGSQYVSKDFRGLWANYKLRQSMSAKGNCYDNAQAESFFSRFKTELVEGGAFSSVEEARNEAFSITQVAM
jgi:putative transposase